MTELERIRRRPGVLWRRSLQAVVLLPPESDQTYALGGTGVLLWELLAEWRTEEDLAAILADAFDVAVDTVAAGLAPILADLRDRGALESTAAAREAPGAG